MGKALRWTEEQLADHMRRVPAAAPSVKEPTAVPASPALVDLLPVAVGELRDTGMNKTEAEYAGMLEARRQRGEVSWWRYEAITLKLADSTRYTPDFAVLLAGGAFEIHETKGGFIREDGWLKLKLAASLFPFRFFLCQKAARKDGGGWSIRRV